MILFTSFLNSYKVYPLPYSFNCESHFYFTPIKSNLWCFDIVGYMAFPGKHCQPTVFYTIKKTNFISNSSKLPITSQVQVELPAHFLSPDMVFILLQLMQVLCILWQSLWVDVCKCPAVYGKYCFLSHSPPLTFTIFPLSFPQWSMILWRRVNDIYVSFGVDHSAVCHYVY